MPSGSAVRHSHHSTNHKVRASAAERASSSARTQRASTGGTRAAAVRKGDAKTGSVRTGSSRTAVSVHPQKVVRRVPAFWIYGLLMVLAVYTAVTCVRQESELQLLRRAKAEIQQRIDRETRQNELLTEQQVEISSGDAIERLAREKLGYVKDGERVFVDANK